MAHKIYALSDLHGHYEISLAMLETIRFDTRNVGGRQLVLIHAGINPDAPLHEQDEEICAWIRDWFYLSPAIKGKTILFGHTPLCYIHGNGCFDIWFDPIHQDKIGIDGGLGPFVHGQLNCVCLNDMSVTVIKKEEIAQGHSLPEKEEEI